MRENNAFGNLYSWVEQKMSEKWGWIIVLTSLLFVFSLFIVSPAKSEALVITEQALEEMIGGYAQSSASFCAGSINQQGELVFYICRKFEDADHRILTVHYGLEGVRIVPVFVQISDPKRPKIKIVEYSIIPDPPQILPAEKIPFLMRVPLYQKPLIKPAPKRA